MKSWLLLFVCNLLLNSVVIGQSEDTIPEFNKKTIYKKNRESTSSFKRENIVIGGTFDLGISNTIGYFLLAPSAGYRVFESVELGLKTGYSLITDFRGTSQHNIFGGPYIKLYPDPSFFIQVDGELTYVSSNKLVYSNALVGIGYNNYLGARTYISTGIKINIIANAIYYNTRFPMPFFGIYWRLK